MTTTISVQITGDEEYGRYIKALICGDPGSGKTLISSTFPNPIYASAEGGLMSIARRKIPFVKVDATEKLLALKSALDQEPHVRAKLLGVDDRMDTVDTVVIDTIDEIARLLVRERQEANKKDTLAIQDWGWLGDQMRAIIRAFRNLDMHVVFTCHLKQSEDSETGRVFFKPAIQGAVGDEISGYVDLALLLKSQTSAKIVDGESRRVTTRFLRTAPDPSFPWIKDRSGQLPPELEVNFVDDFDRINDLIFGGLEETVEIESTLVEFVQEAGADGDEQESVVTSVESEMSEVADTGPHNVPSGDPAEDVPGVDLPVGVDPATGEIRITVDEVRALKHIEKIKLAGPYPCEECGDYFDNDDQRDLSVLKTRKILCAADYKTEMTKKK